MPNAKLVLFIILGLAFSTIGANAEYTWTHERPIIKEARSELAISGNADGCNRNSGAGILRTITAFCNDKPIRGSQEGNGVNISVSHDYVLVFQPFFFNFDGQGAQCIVKLNISGCDPAVSPQFEVISGPPGAAETAAV